MRLLPLLLLFLLANYTNGYRILLLIAFPGPSHILMFKVIVKELLSRGHEVTTITPFTFKETHGNYTEILIDPPYSIGTLVTQEEIYEMKLMSIIDALKIFWVMGLGSAESCLESPSVRNFTLYDNSHFDLILSEQFYQESLLMFAHKYKAPIVSLSTYGYSDFFDRIMGAITTYSFVPHLILSEYNDNMNFFQRAFNFLFSMTDAVVRKYYYLPIMNEMAQKYFSHIPNRPTVQELEKTVSVILVNNHPVMFKPRPLMPSLIDIGGAHINSLKPLPEKIKKFMDEADAGVIYMSLGSYMQSSNMPKEKLSMFIKVFGSLKQRVLWKYEKDDLKNLPSNLMISKWMPQAEILNHPNVILFISHGGLFGTIEGTYFGVPILFTPFYGDQYRNAKMAEKRGYGQHVIFTELNENLLTSKILEMINEEKYRKNAKEMSSILQDSPVKPMELTMYWIEYVVKHKGAKHLKSHAVNMPWYQYLLLDVFSFFVLCGWISCRIVKFGIKKILLKEGRKKKSD